MEGEVQGRYRGGGGEVWQRPSGLDMSQRFVSVEAECQHDISPVCAVVEETLSRKK